MSSFALSTRGVAHADSTVGGGVSPLDITIAAFKPGSALRVTNIRERRQDVSRQRVALAITNADAGPTKDFAALGTAVDVNSAAIITQMREKRTDGYQGATVDFFSATVLRATFHQPAAGDTIDLDCQVIEHKARRGATLRILNATTLRMEWDGTLVAGESIDMSYDLLDVDDLVDELLEIDFKLVRLLGYQGEGKIQDLIIPDTPGNIVSYRSRVFDTKAHAEAATFDLPAGSALETGELARYQVTVDIDKETNDRVSLIAVRVDNLAATPGVS